jgi:ABC-type dipeptide/oligopeptide/nickel transport system permease component
MYAIFVLLGVATIVFFIARMTGDPAAIMLPPDASAKQVNEFRAALGLDKPLSTQYVIYISNLLRFDLGRSLRYNSPALDLILERMLATIQLASAALILSLVVAIPSGILAALRRGTWAEQGVMLFVLFGQSMPIFWMGILFIIIFAVNFRWLPTGGYGDWKNLVLPAIALGSRLSALVTRLLRSSLVEALNSDYIRTARAKGLLPITVVAKHALRNSLLPVVTVVGLEIGSLLGGSVICETVFAWPGVGQLLIKAITYRDFPLVQASIVLLAFAFVVINLVVDILYVFIDPRIRYK